MEVILSTAFGVQRDVQTDQDEPYTPNAALLFRQPAVSISLSKYSNDSCLAPCKGIRIPESRNFLLVESGILALESGIPLKIGIRNPTY